jgi:hypothetical protein
MSTHSGDLPAGLPAQGRDPALSEFGLIAWIAETERKQGPVALMDLYSAVLAHPARMTQMIESLTACGLIETGPGADALLGALRPALDRTLSLKGPTLRNATRELACAMAQRGVRMNAGDEYIDAGMAVISFNRAAGRLLRQPEMTPYILTPVTLTPLAREVLAARGVAHPAPNP